MKKFFDDLRARHSWSEIGSMASESLCEATLGAARLLLRAFAAVLRGFLGLLRATILSLGNIALWCICGIKKAITKRPMVSVAIVAVMGGGISLTVYAQMKARLVTVQHEKDMTEIRLDSVMEAKGMTKTYSRLEE